MTFFYAAGSRAGRIAVRAVRGSAARTGPAVDEVVSGSAVLAVGNRESAGTELSRACRHYPDAVLLAYPH